MSEIPFVNRLGDAIETAISQPERARRRRRRRRFGGLAVAILLVGAGGVTVAEIFDDPEKLATGQVACYSEATFEPEMASMQSGAGREPTELCAELLHTKEPLVACVREEGFVTVFPGPPDTCARLGLKPLPEGYDAARRKVARLRDAVARIARSADCIPPANLAGRLQRVLEREGWRGWRAVVARGRGPCGHTDDIGSALDERRRLLRIRRGEARSLERLVDRTHARLLNGSGDRCYTLAALQARVRRELATVERPIEFRLDTRPLPRYHELLPPSRHRRFQAGCAVIESIAAAPAAIEVTIRDKQP